MLRITYVYSGDNVEVHREGCRDVAKKARRAATVYSTEVESELEAAAEFYSDFINEGSMTAEEARDNYTDFYPCVRLPKGTAEDG